LLTQDPATRDGLLAHLNSRGIGAVFHYVPLHSSPMGRKLGCAARELPVTDSASACLIRLPFYYSITPEEQAEVVREVTVYLRS
jgi:dTDP-4-amino-4,6-dideoxygalactose transaminase